MGRILIFVACLSFLALGANAQNTGLKDGTYDAHDCTAPVSDQRLKLRGNSMSFYESFCQISNPQTLRNLEGPILFDATCEGEGESWATRFILMQTADGGIMLMGENWGERYQFCN